MQLPKKSDVNLMSYDDLLQLSSLLSRDMMAVVAFSK